MEIPLRPNGKPDVEKLLEAIEKDVTESIKQNGYQMPRFIPSKIELEPPQLSEWLKYINLHWNDWSIPVQFSSHRPVLGKIIIKFKNVFQRMVRFVLDPYFQKELQYQEHLVRHLNHASKYIDDRDSNIFWNLNNKIDTEVAAVNQRTDEIFEQLADEILSLKEKIKELEQKKVV